MNCFECNVPGCEFSNPLGQCVKEAPHGSFEEIVKTDGALSSIPAIDEGYFLRSLSDEALTKELELRKHPILQSAQSLVEAVERYVEPKKGDKYLSRTELLMKCNKLKSILNGKEVHD